MEIMKMFLYSIKQHLVCSPIIILTCLTCKWLWLRQLCETGIFKCQGANTAGIFDIKHNSLIAKQLEIENSAFKCCITLLYYFQKNISDKQYDHFSSKNMVHLGILLTPSWNETRMPKKYFVILKKEKKYPMQLRHETVIKKKNPQILL